MPPSSGSLSSARLVSLDVFRGLTIAGMILVNNTGNYPDTYAQLKHAAWHGLTFTDLIFPAFLWIVGVSITLSLPRRLEQGAARGALALHALRRAAIIFALGLFLYLLPHFEFATMRIPGVLQRIAVCYLLCALLFLRSGWRVQASVAAGCSILYWLLMELAPVPGVGAGFWDLERNFARYVDGLLLPGHLYVYTGTWDPEGIVSTLPAITTTLLGVLAGHLLRLDGLERRTRAGWLFVSAVALLLAGLVVSIWMPVNKNLWTVSYALVCAGISAAVFGVLHWLIDLEGWRRFTQPFLMFGRNAIVLYVFSEVLGEGLNFLTIGGPEGETSLRLWTFEKWFLPLAGVKPASVASSLTLVLVCFALAWLMDRKRWYIRI